MKYLGLALLAQLSGVSWLNFLTKTPSSGAAVLFFGVLHRSVGKTYFFMSSIGNESIGRFWANRIIREQLQRCFYEFLSGRKREKHWSLSSCCWNVPAAVLQEQKKNSAAQKASSSESIIGRCYHRVHILVEMKQGQCICPAYTATLLHGEGNSSERGWACTPHPHQPGLILPWSLNVRQKAAVATLCTLWMLLITFEEFHHFVSHGVNVSCMCFFAIVSSSSQWIFPELLHLNLHWKFWIQRTSRVSCFKDFWCRVPFILWILRYLVNISYYRKYHLNYTAPSCLIYHINLMKTKLQLHSFPFSFQPFHSTIQN